MARENPDETEELLRRWARDDFLAFCGRALKPYGLAPAAHHRLLIDKLQAVADGRIKRLMVWMPPGAAKSFYTSILFPTWLMSRWRRRAVIAASHTADLAESFSRKVQAMANDNAALLGYSTRKGSEAAHLWFTTNGNEYRAAGVGGAITGFRADIAIIDDPVKSRQDAESATFRARSWDWFVSDLRTRLKPGAPIVVVGTRWHEDDLQGRILEYQGADWETICIRAECEDENDPLGREIGELLWTDDSYGYGAELRKVREEYDAAGNARDWASLYQQRPAPADGAIFKVAQIGAIDAEPAGVSWVRAWDLAATKAAGTKDPDWTVGVKLGKWNNSFVIADVVRFREGPEMVLNNIVATAKRDGFLTPILLPQDPGQAGKAQIAYLTSRLAGFTVESSPETGDKATRAMPAASQANVGNLVLVRGPWNKAFLDELSVFPAGRKDDQVDALSRAFTKMAIGASLEDQFRAMAS